MAQKWSEDADKGVMQDDRLNSQQLPSMQKGTIHAAN